MYLLRQTVEHQHQLVRREHHGVLQVLDRDALGVALYLGQDDLLGLCQGLFCVHQSTFGVRLVNCPSAGQTTILKTALLAGPAAAVRNASDVCDAAQRRPAGAAGAEDLLAARPKALQLEVHQAEVGEALEQRGGGLVRGVAGAPGSLLEANGAPRRPAERAVLGVGECQQGVVARALCVQDVHVLGGTAHHRLQELLQPL